MYFRKSIVRVVIARRYSRHTVCRLLGGLVGPHTFNFMGVTVFGVCTVHVSKPKARHGTAPTALYLRQIDVDSSRCKRRLSLSNTFFAKCWVYRTYT